MDKLKVWKEELAFNERLKLWDERAGNAKAVLPLKELKSLPKMPGITDDTRRFLRLKSLVWMIRKDKGASIFFSVMRRPFYHLARLIRSYFGKYPMKEEGDFFFYGVSSARELTELIKKKNTVLVAGFSYCHKPLECPSGRFTDECIRDPENLICRQCFIGKALNQLPHGHTVPAIIPTVHYIGRKVFQVIKENPGKEVIFLITACEMTLRMFHDYGNMAGIKGAGIRLGGRICNTMRAFELSEEGIKPGLTVVAQETQDLMMSLIHERQKAESAF